MYVPGVTYRKVPQIDAPPPYLLLFLLKHFHDIIPENRVILLGFPPNVATLSLIHLTAILWSKRPILPSTPSEPKYRKPKEATLYCIEATMMFCSEAKVLGSYIWRVEVPL
jgi:hypothetical protein